MDFDDSPEEAAFRAEAVAFLDAHATPRPDHTDALVSFFEDAGSPEEQLRWVAACRGWQRTKAEHGFAAISWPVEHGGRGGTFLQEIIFAEEEQRYDVATGAFAITLGMVAPTLLAHGTAEQQAHVPAMLSGDEVWCQLFSEPAAGSDLAGIRTRATRDGDGWVIDGQKVWTSGAHYSEWGYLLARSGWDEPKHRGMTAFVLPMDAPGVTVRPLRQMTGGSSFNEVFLDGVRLPDTARLGEVGAGWKVALTTLMNERMSIGGNTTTARSWPALVAMARTAGRDRDPLVRQRLARILTQLEVMRFTRYRILTTIAQGGEPGPEGSGGKLSLVQLMQDIDGLLTELAGPHLGLAGADSELVTGVPGARIGGGTDEVLRNVMAERVLGLPPDPHSDAKVPFSQLLARSSPPE